MSMASLSLRERQKSSIKCMINQANESNSVPVTSAIEPVWKILVLDRFAQDIISPLLTVKELRELGVTLHVLINTEKDPIPEVPAIYFLLPSHDNMQRIFTDLKLQLYDSYYFNFVTSIPAAALDDLANEAFQLGVTQCIAKVVDQYSSFISLEDEFFTLREYQSDAISYHALNRGDVDEDQVDAVVDKIVDGLFSVFVTLGVIPIIRCPKGNAAEMVSSKLDRKLRAALHDSLFSQTATSQDDLMPRVRPLLIVLDRNMDMATPLHHTWTYQALAHDVLNLKLNRISLNESTPDTASTSTSKSKNRTYDLISSDKFWNLHKGSPFPQVAEAVQEELESYRSSEDEVKRLKASMGLDGNDESVVILNDTTAKLNSAVSSLPELLEKKKLIDMHTTVATAILDQIKARKLDSFFETEEKILCKSAGDRNPLDLIFDSTAGNAEDKMRLYLLNYICEGTTLSAEECKKYESALADTGCDMRPLSYIKRWKTFARMPSLSSSISYGQGTKTVSMFSKLMSQGSQFVMEGVKNLVVKKHSLPFTRIADALLENKNSAEVDNFHYFDPKSKSHQQPPQSSNSSTPFQEAIVFVVGGGNYIEYQNLMDYSKSKINKGTLRRLIYGCTDVVNADAFLTQLSKLGDAL